MKPIWIWLFPLLIGLLAAYLGRKYHPWTWEDTVDKCFTLGLGSLVTILAIVASFALGGGVAMLIGHQADCSWHQYWTAEMVSMRSADGVQGRISGGLFLIVGQVDSRQVYYFYTQNGDGALQPHRWVADSDTYLYEEDRTDARVVGFDTAFRHAWVNWFGLPNRRVRMDFHIPKGTLKRSFEVQ